MSLKLKEDFIERNKIFLDKTLNENLLRENKRFLDLKNKLIKKLKNEISKSIKKQIDDSYSKYIEFLLADIIRKIDVIDDASKIEIALNSKDYEYYRKRSEKIKKELKKSVDICESSKNFIGGFKILLFKRRMIYDFTIENLINENSSIIEDEFINSLSDSKIKEIDQKFESFILNQKENLRENFK